MNADIDRSAEHQKGQGAEQEAQEHAPSTGDKASPENILALAKKVIINPIGFYQEMPKSGGLTDPLVFMVVLSVVAGVISAMLSLIGLGASAAMAGGLAAIILIPIFVVIFGFIGAAIAHVIWKLMGSQEDFETAFRCVAYTAAVTPITAVLNIIPYIGSFASALWPMALLALASIHVHRRSPQASWAVFGAIGIILVFISVGGEHAGRQLASDMDDWREILEQQNP